LCIDIFSDKGVFSYNSEWTDLINQVSRC
jgi:hypothetical protein